MSLVVSMVVLGVVAGHLVDLLHDGSDAVFVDVLGFGWFGEQLDFDITNDWKFDFLVTVNMGISNRGTCSSGELSILFNVFFQPRVDRNLSTFTVKDFMRNYWDIS